MHVNEREHVERWELQRYVELGSTAARIAYNWVLPSSKPLHQLGHPHALPAKRANLVITSLTS